VHANETQAIEVGRRSAEHIVAPSAHESLDERVGAGAAIENVDSRTAPEDVVTTTTD
jgi:hypothetical protein